MRLFASLLVLNVQLCGIFAFLPGPSELTADRAATSNPFDNEIVEGYECGNIFFSDSEVNDALSTALDNVDKGFTFPETYQGKLYFDARYKEYLLWPIRKGVQILRHTKFPKTSFRIVFTRDFKEVIDVIAKITINEYTKCIRRGNSRTGSSVSVPENPNGYLCGFEFFTDEFIEEYLPPTLQRFQEKGKALNLYVGLLYPKNSGFQILPIINNGMHKSVNAHFGPYSLVINKDGGLIDVVVRGFGGNYLRCIRSRKPPKAPESDPHSKLFVPPPKSGYQCGRVFFC